MKKITITSAAVEVLNKIAKPLSAEEIYDSILKQQLYEFKAKEPLSILKSELRKHSEGIELKGKGGTKYFVFQKDKTYALKNKLSEK
ncbi:MAG: HTH domain-containing protein [Cyclobacteriaceae bacterium]